MVAWRAQWVIAAGALFACAPDTTPSADTAAPDSADIGVPPDDAAPEAVIDTSEPEDTAAVDIRVDTLIDAIPVDTLDADTTPVDTEVADTVETSVLDTTPTDTAVADTSVTDASEPDTALADTGTPPADSAEVADVVADPWAPGALAYERVSNIIAVGDLSRVRFHPSGAFALVLGAPNKVLRYDAEARALTSLGTLGTSLADLDVAPEGEFVIVGSDGADARLWVASLDQAGALVATPTAIPTGTPRAVTVEPPSFRAAPEVPARFVIGAAGANDSIAYAYLFDRESGLSAVRGFNTNAGLLDLMWADPALQGGSPHVVTSEGVNGAGSHTWVLASDLVVTNGWSPGFGNGGRADWRPGGGYGLVTGWSSNKLYVFDGAWELATLPVPTGASPNAVRWRDGRRALVVGRVISSDPYAVVIEVRAGDTSAWPATFVDQSLRDFAEAPWFGNSSSMHLLDVDWRPGVACDEGLIVGTAASAGGFGYAIRFHDSADEACVP